MIRYGRYIAIQVESADPLQFIKLMTNQGIALSDVTVEDICLYVVVKEQNLPIIQNLTDKAGARMTVLHHVGRRWIHMSWLQRPILILGVLLLCCITWFVSGRILFVEVEGNLTIPTSEILEEAKLCGIKIGVPSRAVRSEQVKNQLLAAIPELQWIGVNTNGCTATVQVKERGPIHNINDTTGNIVAKIDGVIVNMTVLRGTALCSPGQAVKAGQMLVSGYIDQGFKLQATGADAEVLAQTRRTISVISPATKTTRGRILGTHTRYSLLIGKKMINFCKDSGICGTTCVKIYRERHLTLPGGFRLPIALVTETCTEYELDAQTVSTDDAGASMRRFARRYLSEQMVTGQVLSDFTSFQARQGRHCLAGDYVCLEMIGRINDKERILHDR